jgi:hypothetical protein
VLVTGPVEHEPAAMVVPHDVDSVMFRVSQQLQWMTNKQYIATFGEAPPTAPILRIIAATWKDHWDYKEEWACEL